MVKILVVGDLHGRKPRIPRKLKYDVIVLVGDVCSDMEIGPFYKKWFRALKKNPDMDTGIDEFIISKVGKKEFKAMEKRSLEKGREIVKDFNSLGKPIFMVAGNWDYSYGPSKIKDMHKTDYAYFKAFLDWWAGDKINPRLTKGFKNVHDCMLHLNKSHGVNFVGYGLSSASEKPKSKKRLKGLKKKQMDLLIKAYEKIVNKLNRAYDRRNKNFPTVFISHNIPYNTKLDTVTDKKSYAYKKHLGSSIARDFCVRKKPLVCVGGHIHDHRGKDKIGKTVVVNPGFGPKAHVLIDIDEKKGKVKNVKFLK